MPCCKGTSASHQFNNLEFHKRDIVL